MVELSAPSKGSIKAVGNNLFNYCWGREIAERKKFHLNTSPILGFPETYNDIPGTKILENEFITPGNTQIFDMEKIYNHNGKITIRGYPQRYEYYAFNKNKIKEWLKIENEDDYETPSPNDIVVHIRLGDYVNLGWNLPIEYYQAILQKETYDKCYIITDDPNNALLKKITADGAIIVDNSRFGTYEHIADFVFAKRAMKLIISPSTFSWWAAFLGSGSVYFPCIKYPWVGSPKKDEIDLRVYDCSRYKFLHIEN